MDKKEEEKYRIAAASSDGIVVNQHFGRAETFYIYEASSREEPRYLEKREVEPLCQGGNHQEAKLTESVEHLKDCQYVLVSRIGPGAVAALEQKGITPMELPGMIEESIHRLITYIEIQNLTM
ncbi:MAG: dinitrogenase iron-molybdenum cofactor biosynthesis protein [Lachnospiraceae bacterium]|nr:dinitrogenase iron-molybdenum cofactor biosynthesis protein [Lachnospiraceae bacterium]